MMGTFQTLAFIGTAILGFNIALLLWVAVRFSLGFWWAMWASSGIIAITSWAMIAISS